MIYSGTLTFSSQKYLEWTVIQSVKFLTIIIINSIWTYVLNLFFLYSFICLLDSECWKNCTVSEGLSFVTTLHKIE